MAKINNKQAAAYAKPHTDVKQSKMVDPNTLKAGDVNCETGRMRVSLGDPGNDYIETDGIKIRGTGAATKGLKARGPMA